MTAVDGYDARTYGDAFADVYDQWYAEVGDPVAAAACLAALAGEASAGAVLELGVGSGRLAVPLAALGVEVWGVDASPAMLERLAARPGGDRVRAVLADMADPRTALAGAPPFAVVVVAFNTFFLLASEALQRSCLAACRSLLAAGGTVVVECDVPAAPPTGVERVVEPRRIGVDHVVLTVSEHDPATQVVHGQHVELREDGIRLRPWMLRYVTPEQLDALAAEAGLAPHERWRGWDRTPYAPGEVMHVSTYRAG